MAPRENNVYVYLWGNEKCRGAYITTLAGGVNALKKVFFFALVLKLSWAAELFILCKWKALGVSSVSLQWSEKMPQAFFDSYGNLVRFPARCSPSCSHFSFFQFHFFFQALPPFSFSFSLNSVAQVRNLVLGWLAFFRPRWHKIYTKIRSCLQIKLTKRSFYLF